jgi:hypothetical protein
MNDRIRELEERCWEELGEEECYYTVFNREKFAELIVKECIDIVEDEDTGDIYGKSARLAMIRIRQHFGVEE